MGENYECCILEDFINVMTYDLHGDWDNYADHHAPLHARHETTTTTSDQTQPFKPNIRSQTFQPQPTNQIY